MGEGPRVGHFLFRAGLPSSPPRTFLSGFPNGALPQIFSIVPVGWDQGAFGDESQGLGLE